MKKSFYYLGFLVILLFSFGQNLLSYNQDTYEKIKIISDRQKNNQPINPAQLHFVGVDLRNADLSGFNLQGINLSNAHLGNANLLFANLQGANLVAANLEGANLRSANLRGANLAGANLSNAMLETANLEGASLSRANLTGASLLTAKQTLSLTAPGGMQTTYSGPKVTGTDFKDVKGLSDKEKKYLRENGAINVPE